MMRIFLALAILSGGAGCAHRSTNIERAAGAFRLLQTRQDRVAGMLGQPGGVVELRDHMHGCLERWSYTGVQRAQGEQVLFVDFDEQGRVCDVAWGHTVSRFE